MTSEQSEILAASEEEPVQAGDTEGTAAPWEYQPNANNRLGHLVHNRLDASMDFHAANRASGLVARDILNTYHRQATGQILGAATELFSTDAHEATYVHIKDLEAMRTTLLQIQSEVPRDTEEIDAPLVDGPDIDADLAMAHTRLVGGLEWLDSVLGPIAPEAPDGVA